MPLSKPQLLTNEITELSIKFGVKLYRYGNPGYSKDGYCAAYVKLKPLNDYKELTHDIQWVFTNGQQTRTSKRWKIHKMIETHRKDKTAAARAHNLFQIKDIS